MSFATLAADQKLAQAADLLTGDLERIITRVLKTDPRLAVERVGGRWLVVDVANNGTPMYPSDSLASCERFMRAFVAKTPGASVDEASLRARPWVTQPLADVIPIRRAESA